MNRGDLAQLRLGSVQLATIIFAIVASIFPSQIIASEFDSSLCFSTEELEPQQSYKLYSNSDIGFIFNLPTYVTGYVLEGEIEEFYSKKTGIFHWGKRQTRFQNVTGPFSFGSNISTLFMGGVSLHAIASRNGANICFCDAHLPTDRQMMEKIGQQNTHHAQQYRDRRDTCIETVEGLLE